MVLKSGLKLFETGEKHCRSEKKYARGNVPLDGGMALPGGCGWRGMILFVSYSQLARNLPSRWKVDVSASLMETYNRTMSACHK